MHLACCQSYKVDQTEKSTMYRTKHSVIKAAIVTETYKIECATASLSFIIMWFEEGSCLNVFENVCVGMGSGHIYLIFIFVREFSLFIRAILYIHYTCTTVQLFNFLNFPPFSFPNVLFVDYLISLNKIFEIMTWSIVWTFEL